MARLLNMRPDDEVEPPLSAHLLHLKKENQRPRSIRERRLTVLRVARFLGHPVSIATKEELVAWQDARVAVLEPASMHNEIVHIACYLKWMLNTDLRDDDVGRCLVRPKKVHQGEPHPISETNLRRAIGAADAEMTAWLRLGSESGLRCMEIAKVEAGDIGEMLRVVGKGNKERRTVLSAGLREILLTGPFNRTGHLFSRIDGKPGPPSATRVSERINDHLHALGIEDTAHSLRHRFGTEMYRLCRDPFQVASYMGHASVDTTRGYVRLVDDNSSKLAEALAALGAA
jgi:integrase/recombinase XerC